MSMAVRCIPLPIDPSFFYPDMRPILAYDGGRVYASETGGRYHLVLQDTRPGAYLEWEQVGGPALSPPPARVYSFATPADRENYLSEHLSWCHPIAQRTACRKATSCLSRF